MSLYYVFFKQKNNFNPFSTVSNKQLIINSRMQTKFTFAAGFTFEFAISQTCG